MVSPINLSFPISHTYLRLHRHLWRYYQCEVRRVSQTPTTNLSKLPLRLNLDISASLLKRPTDPFGSSVATTVTIRRTPSLPSPPPMAASPSTTSVAGAGSLLSFSSSLSSPSRRLLLPLVRRSSGGAGHRAARIPAISAKIREIFMPALSSTMTEGKIVSWVKTEGDRLSKGESVVVVESDKADMDVETFYDGILAAIVVPAGESAPVGAPIGLLAETEDEVPLAKAQAQSQSQSQPAPVTQSPPSPPSAAAPSPPPPAPVATPVAVSEGPRKIVATPFAKKLAKQYKVDIGTVVGTGPYGRITPSDIEAAAGIQPKMPASSPSPAVTSVPQSPSPSADARAKAPAAALPPIRGSTVVPFTTMQAAVSKNMVESLSVPTFRVGYPVTTDALDALYEKVYFYLIEISIMIYEKTFVDGHFCLGTFTVSNLGMFGVDRFDAILPPGQVCSV
ncbi:hypothetical protein GW17_00060948 [Ensete ventricosum]|nr:hypothetical protein GW17_00060948 [Ensete ventricosum]